MHNPQPLALYDKISMGNKKNKNKNEILDKFMHTYIISLIVY